jgi:hypothetical protein
MKTPMQEVYEKFHSMTDAGFAMWMINAKLLEKEKALIEKVYWEGGQDVFTYGSTYKSWFDKHAEDETTTKD